MTPERYRRVVEIFEAASVRSPEARRAFLAETCADDDLYREVEAMLAADARSHGFLDTPADDIAAAAVVARESKSLIGQRLGHYEIVSLLGVGGMGEVYRARDPRLGRDVAIKVSAEQLAAPPFQGVSLAVYAKPRCSAFIASLSVVIRGGWSLARLSPSSAFELSRWRGGRSRVRW
jgi:hypothetical protein